MTAKRVNPAPESASPAPTPVAVPPPMVLPGNTIGMLGGGQLGRMFALAAAQLGYRMVVLGDTADCPAGSVSNQALIGPANSRPLLDQLARLCDVVTLEFENIPVDAVEYLTERVGVYPQANVLRIAQDRGIEKQTLSDAGLPVTPFHLVHCPVDLEDAKHKLGFPLVVKTTRDGYDGKGQWKIESAADFRAWIDQAAPSRTSRFDRPLIAEAWISYQKEISVIIARGAAPIDGDPISSFPVAVFPVFENQHRHHILDVTTCPASLDPAIAQQAKAMAIRAAEALGLFGLICIEFFVDARGELLINEIAPRPHNSGHLTIEACQTSQFEQQLRSVCGLPLGNTELIVPAAAMVNVMGQAWRDGTPDWYALLQIPGSHLHLYDKHDAQPGRKMGHVTLVGEPEELPPRIRAVQRILGS